MRWEWVPVVSHCIQCPPTNMDVAFSRLDKTPNCLCLVHFHMETAPSSSPHTLPLLGHNSNLPWNRQAGWVQAGASTFVPYPWVGALWCYLDLLLYSRRKSEHTLQAKLGPSRPGMGSCSTPPPGHPACWNSSPAPFCPPSHVPPAQNSPFARTQFS